MVGLARDFTIRPFQKHLIAGQTRRRRERVDFASKSGWHEWHVTQFSSAVREPSISGYRNLSLIGASMSTMLRFLRKSVPFGWGLLCLFVVQALVSFLEDAQPISQWLLGSFVVLCWPSLLVGLNITTDGIRRHARELDFLNMCGGIAVAVVSLGCLLDYLGVASVAKAGDLQVSNPGFKVTFYVTLLFGGLVGFGKNRELQDDDKSRRRDASE